MDLRHSSFGFNPDRIREIRVKLVGAVPIHFGPRKTRSDAKGGGKDETGESRNRETEI